ncbi:MAG: rhodanese-like domain-containing protein [Desulfobacterales bacterium]|nr:rhodanese-like domain-containing protein [Desulfobacterales bacterium]
MIRIGTIVIALIFGGFAFAHADEITLEKYLSGFDYKARKEMKIDSAELTRGLEEGRIQLIDIRFTEEVSAWATGFATAIPLDELPGRLDELQKDKIIVTACPHKDRAILAMAYLRTRGYRAKYLVDGLIGLAEHLRGDRARDFIEAMKKKGQIFIFDK